MDPKSDSQFGPFESVVVELEFASDSDYCRSFHPNYEANRPHLDHQPPFRRSKQTAVAAASSRIDVVVAGDSVVVEWVWVMETIEMILPTKRKEIRNRSNRMRTEHRTRSEYWNKIVVGLCAVDVVEVAAEAVPFDQHHRSGSSTTP